MKPEYATNNRANESVSKFKLLSSYGGPGSIVHAEYGSIMISCIEEWGFIKKVDEFILSASETNATDPRKYVEDHLRRENIFLSNDIRLLDSLKSIKGLINLEYLVLLPDIEQNEQLNTIEKGQTQLAISSTYMPKGFFDGSRNYKKYNEWYNLWALGDGIFSPPRYVFNREKATMGSTRYTALLRQDNIILICNQGHISDFPWSRYLRWKNDSPAERYSEVDLFNLQPCCSDPQIQITDSTASATGFDGKFIKCKAPGCQYSSGTSLKGIMSIKLICPGHKPWEAETGGASNHFGSPSSRRNDPPWEPCLNEDNQRKVKISLTTGNDLYYSKTLLSLFMPGPLFQDQNTQRLTALVIEKQEAIESDNLELAVDINKEIKILKEKIQLIQPPERSAEEQEEYYRFQEYTALSLRPTEEINGYNEDLQVHDVTTNLNERISPYFNRILRLDNIKLTTAQLAFSRIEPLDADAVSVRARNIFRTSPELVRSYPVVENYGEAIFFSFNHQMIQDFAIDQERFNRLIAKERIPFAQPAEAQAANKNWPLYLIHTFSHLIMRELEFRCGYPTASLSERLYVSYADSTEAMYGCLIYTSEGEEGSMGGLIAQTRKDNLNGLLNGALYRSTVCNSDPLCWESEGQGLFELNLASCFSCSLVSETSCEERNLYLDRRMLIDEEHGFFKDYDPKL